MTEQHRLLAFSVEALKALAHSSQNPVHRFCFESMKLSVQHNSLLVMAFRTQLKLFRHLGIMCGNTPYNFLPSQTE